MTALSDYLSSQLVQHIFRTSTFTKPTTLAVALCTASPSDTSTGNLTGFEVVNAGGYARVAVNPLDANWNNITGGPPSTQTTSNTNAINFATATSDWGTITYTAICDNSTWGSGNLFFWGALTANKVVLNGDSFSFSAGQLQIQTDT